jgi:hypothetical protein
MNTIVLICCAQVINQLYQVELLVAGEIELANLLVNRYQRLLKFVYHFSQNGPEFIRRYHLTQF